MPSKFKPIKMNSKHIDKGYIKSMKSMLKDARLGVGNSEVQQELTRIYNDCDDLIAKKLTITDPEGKKLLIVIGEEHFQRKSLLVELLFLKLAEKHGIKNCAAEVSDKLLGSIRSNMNPSDQSLNLSFLVPFLDKQHMNVIAADPDCKLSRKDRENNMKQILYALNDHAIFITGANHLVSIESDPLINSRFNVLLINAMNLDDDTVNQYRQLSDYQADLLNLVMNSEYALQAKITANLSVVDHLAIQTLPSLDDMIKNAISKKAEKDESPESDESIELDEETGPELERDGFDLD